ncbi:(2Fe-2S)-binding protein [Georgenia sp. SYP-B2076]|uniref:(2Fe-2S)-binding protein n=1 Tax=Georgenia sp. SYP-B2076 TaxID=2495881 RepID=UPI000F8DB840|nr:(2Fe-2S)-binding protein [Georgenia sp. SYP-B2076]
MNEIPGGSEVDVRATVNGAAVHRTVPARLSLADFLRDHLRLTGTHLGCEQGVCGACTVMVDGRSVRACLMLAAQADGSEVTTVEGLEDNEHAARLRGALSRHHGLQCGFCTPGIVVAACELLGRCTQPPAEDEVRETLSGNICRCTGYTGIVDAVLEAGQSVGS